MSDMLKVFVKQEIDSSIKETYPHVQYPSGILAKVINVKENAGRFVCTLKILDKNKNVDNRFPEVPFVNTDIAFQKNDIAVVLLLYGECNPYIIGRYEACR